jgi:tRNA nucleotidyltransferase/poly(A) polymerase
VNAIETHELVERVIQETPNDVLDVLDAITGIGHEAYLVGGCVRDVLLNLSPKDYD